jgi:hypothetical protein
MPDWTFKAGELYASRSQVRARYREFWKGILVRDGQVAIIQAHRGLARRIHYRDSLDPESMTLHYVGEGKSGDQKLTRANQALVDAASSGQGVEVFFDCGDIQLPYGNERGFEKHYLAGGSWRVVSARYHWSAAEGRKVWSFTLVPRDESTRRVLQTIFLDAALGFERLLKQFARVRHDLYSGYEHILRARDSIAGHVGEYFAVKGFNAANRERPLVRVRSNFPDLDAIQTGSGTRFAVKTVTARRQNTSNIWTPLADLPRTIDAFLVLDLDRDMLEPRGLFKLPVSKARRFWTIDSYQHTGKLIIDDRFRDVAEQIGLG